MKMFESIQKAITESYLWYIKTKRSNLQIKKRLLKSYSLKKNNICIKNCYVICLYTKEFHGVGGGLADRLKGMLCTYSVCKNLGLPFKIFFTAPFPLDSYFIPNTYDWRINQDQVNFNLKDSNVVILNNCSDGEWCQKKQKAYMERCLRSVKGQVHVYTNVSFVYKLNYGELFNELFRPSEQLAKSIAIHKDCIGQKYISISCRFLDLCGDFNETCRQKKIFSEKGRKIVFKSIIKKISELRNENPDCKVLVNSDSSTFLKACENFDYVYIIPGNVTHIDNKQNEYTYEKYEKTFLDFMMIAHAEKIFIIKNNLMMNSGYPKAASLIYGKPFEVIEIENYPENELVANGTAFLQSTKDLKGFIKTKPNVLKSVLNEITSHSDSVAVWGTGVWGKMIYEILKKNKIKVSFFIDSNQEKWQTRFCGNAIKAPDSLKNYTGVLFIAVKNHDVEIAETVKKIDNQKITVVLLSEFLKKLAQNM